MHILCGSRHPSVLHADGKVPTTENINTQNASHEPRHPGIHISARFDVLNRAGINSGDDDEVAMIIVPVRVIRKDGTLSHLTYAFVSLLHKIGSNGTKKKITIDTMGVPHAMQATTVKNIQVSDLGQEHIINLPVLYAKDRIPDH